ncbi:PrsW family intramembrane metalloprotease [filamentous cyanobacterium LEGE 11480]|uniref:PrsW family intramembrane metalloprotease n=1 Tax=Romeriopsis navalis LEGE 11480 TaxID=2777977 RepID=A0A928VRG5_9CYAN|nr:PrsW family glutamic-type intramembrane protease [Romeriopsis navalis]MBE9030759.1 PrsW family intramembrane metalloprotease [Romeriopsis navalis LEGE 11480]
MVSADLINRLQWFPIVIWSVVPPFSLLLLYHRRIRAAPPVNGAAALFGIGMLAGLMAWGLEHGLWLMVQALPISLRLNPTVPEQTLFSMVLWQAAVTAPAAEACKLAAVVLPLGWLVRRYQRVPAQPSTVLLATIAVALGFAAQTSLVALWYGRESVMNVLLMMPMQMVFSMPWGFALGVGLCRMSRHLEYSTKLTLHGWLAACLCHAAWNGLILFSQTPGRLLLLQSSTNVTAAYLLYGLFPWALWLWWQTERMLMRSQGEVPPRLITARTSGQLMRQYVTIFVCLGFGGAALNSLRDFGNSLKFTWDLRMTFDQLTVIGLGQALLRTVILAVIALYIFMRLRQPSDAS